MSDYIRKEASKIVVGERLNDLVLKTLGRVYIETGSKKELLDDLIQRILDASLATSKSSGSNITTVDTEKDLENLKYPGDNNFVFVSDSKNLYITAGGEYIPIVAANDVEINWSNVKGNYVKLTGDKMTGDLTVPNLIAKQQLQSQTYTEAPLKVNSNVMVKNLNSEYLNGKKWDEFTRRNEPEKVTGAWNFNNIETFNDTVVFNNNIGSSQFKSGFAGIGWRLNATSNTLTIDNLIVRKTMNVYELVVNKISATNGALWVSDSGKIKEFELLYPVFNDSGTALIYTPEQLEHNEKVWIEDVDENGNLTGEYVQAVGDIVLDKEVSLPLYNKTTGQREPRFIYDYYFNGPIYSITLEDDLTPFRVNDIIRCQQFKDNNIVYYDAIVINTNDCLYIRLYQLKENNSDIIYSDTPAENQPLVRIGNISDENRQGAIYLTSSDEDSPFIDIMRNINRPDFTTDLLCKDEGSNVLYNSSARSMRLGKLDGIYDSAFGADQPHGMGMYAENVYIKGKFVQVEEGKEYLLPIYKGEFSSSEIYFYYNYVFYKNKYWLLVKDDLEGTTGVYPDFIEPDFEKTEIQTNSYWQIYLSGVAGEPGVSSLTSYVFTRSETKPKTPQGGSWEDPLPVNNLWSDGVPSGKDPLWMSYKLFYSDNRETLDWSEPVVMSTSDTVEVKYSNEPLEPGTPSSKPNLWYDEATEQSVWMAVRNWFDGAWKEWQVSRIKGEDGQPGEPGDDGFTVVLSNETHTIVVDKNSRTINDEEIVCETSLYQLTTLIRHKTEIINDLPINVVSSITENNNKNVLKLIIPKDTLITNFEVALKITYKNIEIRKVMSISAVENGTASFITLSGDQIFVYKKTEEGISNVATPKSITLTANPNNCKITGWFVKPVNNNYIEVLNEDGSSITSRNFIINPDHEYWNGQANITIKVQADDLYDEMSIVKLYDGLDGDSVEGLQGAVCRTTEWSLNTDYKDGTELENGIKYLDIVTTTNSPGKFSVFQCIKSHTSNNENKPNVIEDNDYWKKLNQATPIYTPLIFAENAVFYMASTNELAILDENNEVIAAISGSNNEGFTMWSGGQTPKDSTFKVHRDGSLIATKATLEGSFTVKAHNDERSISLMINEDKTRSIEDDPVIKITDADGSLVTELNGNEYTDTGSMFEEETGSLIPKTTSGTLTNGTTTLSSNNNYSYIEYQENKTVYYELTDKIYHGKPITFKTNNISTTLSSQLWGLNQWKSVSQSTNNGSSIGFFTTSFGLCYASCALVIRKYDEKGNYLRDVTVDKTLAETTCRGEYNTNSGGTNISEMPLRGTDGVSNNSIEELTTSFNSEYGVLGIGQRSINMDYSGINAYTGGSGYAQLCLLVKIKTQLNIMYYKNSAIEVTLLIPKFTYSLNDNSINYEINGYASKYFANGLVLGTKKTNGVQFFNKDGNMNIELACNSRSLRINNDSLSYRTKGGSVYCPVMFLIAYSTIIYSKSVRLNFSDNGIVNSSYSNNTFTFDLSKYNDSSIFGCSVSDFRFVIAPLHTSAVNLSYNLSGTTLKVYTTADNIDVTIYGVSSY
jgi:hypothetical protein